MTVSDKNVPFPVVQGGPSKLLHFVTFRNMQVFLWCGAVSTTFNPQARGPDFVSCSRLLIP